MSLLVRAPVHARSCSDGASERGERVRSFVRLSVLRLQAALNGPTEDFSLARGRAGGLLCLAGLRDYLRNDPLDKDWLEEQLQQLLIAAASLPHGLFSGAQGVLFAAQELARVFRFGFVAEAMSEFDELLADMLRHDTVAPHPFDLIEGCSGLLVYACYRAMHGASASNLKLAVDRLAESACRSDGQAHWPSMPAWLRGSPLGAEYPKGCVETGVAHGQAGVMGALALAVSSGMDRRDSTRQLLAESVEFLRHHELCQQIAHFSSVAGAAGPSRCAWCNGDLGMLGPLRLASRALQDESLNAWSRSIQVSALRRPRDSLGFEDAWLCHGFGGAAWALRRAGRTNAALACEYEALGVQGAGLASLHQALKSGRELPWSLLHGVGGLALALAESEGYECPLDWGLPFLV